VDYGPREIHCGSEWQRGGVSQTSAPVSGLGALCAQIPGYRVSDDVVSGMRMAEGLHDIARAVLCFALPRCASFGV
jgi:hypothetical protein